MNNPWLEVIEVRDARRVRVRLPGELDLAGHRRWAKGCGGFAVTGGSAHVDRLIGFVRLDRQLPLDGHTR